MGLFTVLEINPGILSDSEACSARSDGHARHMRVSIWPVR